MQRPIEADAALLSTRSGMRLAVGKLVGYVAGAGEDGLEGRVDKAWEKINRSVPVGRCCSFVPRSRPLRVWKRDVVPIDVR